MSQASEHHNWLFSYKQNSVKSKKKKKSQIHDVQKTKISRRLLTGTDWSSGAKLGMEADAGVDWEWEDRPCGGGGDMLPRLFSSLLHTFNTCVSCRVVSPLQPSTLPQGTINMNQCSDVVDGESRTGQKNSLCILTPEKEHFIRAECKEIINGWDRQHPGVS